MVPISLYDTLCFSFDLGTNALRVSCQWAAGLRTHESHPQPATGRPPSASAGVFEPLPGEAENLVYRALQRLRERAGIEAGAQVMLHKRIPAAAGLGGGSSDAAAALLAANRGWQLNWPLARLGEVAAEMGSDIPFFLHGRPARCQGRGERVTPHRSACQIAFVVVRPPRGLSTAEVYRQTVPPTRPSSIDRLTDAWQSGQPAWIARSLFNRLQPAAECLSPWIARLNREFARLELPGHQMSGSGTSYFGICRSVAHARQVRQILKARQLGHTFCVTSKSVARFGYCRTSQN